LAANAIHKTRIEPHTLRAQPGDGTPACALLGSAEGQACHIDANSMHCNGTSQADLLLFKTMPRFSPATWLLAIA
jgi:hypothetical protein